MIDPDSIEASDVQIVQHALICKDCTLIPRELDVTDRELHAITDSEYVTWVTIEGRTFTVALSGPWCSVGDLAECEQWANRLV